jgi:ribonuclease E
MENIEQLIQQAADKDYSAANTTFVDIMNQKMSDTLEQEKIKVSAEIYNGMEEDEEQLELDFEDDESEEDDVDVDDDDDTDDSDEDTEES